MVKKEDLAKSVAVLHAQGLPRENRPSLNDVFKSSGFAPTAFEERVRFVYGTAQELERTLSYMEGVLTARVHVVMPEKARRSEVQNPPSASVFIGYDDKVAFDLQVPKVRHLVAQSIEGLSESRVDVFISPIKVDLAKVVATPVTSFMGITVAQSSVMGLAILLGAIVALLVVILYLTSAKILPYANKLKELVWKMYP
jgi:type III secretion protein J